MPTPAFLCGAMASKVGARIAVEKSRRARGKGGPAPRTAPAPAGDPSRRAPVDNAVLPAILRRLRREAARQQAPIVTLIAVTTREPWRVLSSCILSLRTQDQVTAKAAERMFARWPTIEAMAGADVKEVEKAIFPVGFYRTKAPQLVEMARRILDEWKGRVPDEIDELVKLKGVGRKTANLVVVAGYDKPGICVDTHVHRITNIWGYVKTKTPEQTEIALREKLPRRYWMEINDLLVSFGQTICRPLSPRCSECPIEQWCPKIGVGRRR
jgi:endonuclease-3